MHCSLLLMKYIIMFKQNRRLFVCAYTVAHFININPVYELKDMHVERENWKGLGCIFVVVTCDWQWQMALWPPALLRHYYRQRHTAADAMPPPKRRWRRHAKRQQWRSTGEHKSQKWIRERWQWYWNLIYITNLIRYAWHVQKPGKGYQRYSKYNVVVLCMYRAIRLPGALSELFSFCLRTQLHSTARERIISEGEAEAWFISVRWPPEKLVLHPLLLKGGLAARRRPLAEAVGLLPPWCLMLLRSNKAFFPR